MAAHAPWQEEVEETPVKTWMTSKWRRIMLIVIALEIIPVVYGAIILFAAAAKARGFGNLLEYTNPALWITGAVIAGHVVLFIGTVGLLMNAEWGTESVKIGVGVVFVFQCLAIAVAGASWIGDMFAVGQGRYLDANGEPMMMTGPVIATVSMNRFLNPRMFATTWLSIAQMITLMVGIEKEKKDTRPLPNAKPKEESDIAKEDAGAFVALYAANKTKNYAGVGFGEGQPHRGNLILGLALGGLLVFMPLCIIAIKMGKADLKKMDLGFIDQSGRGTTKTGVIVGWIGIGLWIVGLVLIILMVAGLVALF